MPYIDTDVVTDVQSVYLYALMLDLCVWIGAIMCFEMQLVPKKYRASILKDRQSLYK